MLKDIIQRPIAVLLCFGVLLLAGILVSSRIPISLLPPTDVPHLKVTIRYPEATARQIEDAVVTPLRNRLLQVNALRDVWSSTEDGRSVLDLFFDYQTNMQLSYIEVNEKIDQMMSDFPSEMNRPDVTYLGLGDLPVLYLSVIPLNQEETDFVQFGHFCSNVVKKRLEQLPEVAIVDLTGRVSNKIVVTPRAEVFSTIGLTVADFKDIIRDNNLNLGNLILKDGHYEFVVDFLSEINSVEDLENIRFNYDGHVYKMGDLVTVSMTELEPTGQYIFNGQRGILMSVRKQANAQLFKMNESIQNTVNSLSSDYPEFAFEISRDQSKLLRVSFSNLGSSILIGGIMAILILFFAYREFSSVLFIGLVVPGSLVLSILVFYLVGLSINIISLSGLLLGIGLMIDNSIIVIDTIRQYRLNGSSILEACTKAPLEVMSPLLSSTLTTCSIFIPLLFLSGVTGALFKDQAYSVSISLVISLLLALILIPTLYYLTKPKIKTTSNASRKERKQVIRRFENVLRRGVYIIILIVFSFLAFSAWRVNHIQTEAFPKISRDGFFMHIDWNDNINLDENLLRTKKIVSKFDEDYVDVQALIGETQYSFSTDNQSTNETSLYFLGESLNQNEELKNRLLQIRDVFPLAIIEVTDIANAFDALFSASTNSLYLLINKRNSADHFTWQEIKDLEKRLSDSGVVIIEPSSKQVMLIDVDRNKALSYGISMDKIENAITLLLNQYELGQLDVGNEQIPIYWNNNSGDFASALANSRVSIKRDTAYNLGDFTKIRYLVSPKLIQATMLGEALRWQVMTPADSAISKVDSIKMKDGNNTYDLIGPYFENKKMLTQMRNILIISLLLLYFILSIQFESLWLPWIVLLILPIGLAGAVVFLELAGLSLNLLSFIGLIVMGGIAVNDAILKVDIIKKGVQSGLSLEDSIVEAAYRRITPILMTSLTTLLALLPILFTDGLAGELQKPLAVAIIGGIVTSTIASITVLPLITRALFRIFYRSKIANNSL